MQRKKYTKQLENTSEVSNYISSAHVKEGEIRIKNPYGMHSRPAALFVKVASRYDANVRLFKVEDPTHREVSGKSIMGIMTLELSQGSHVHLHVSGNGDAYECFDKLSELVESGFEKAYKNKL